MFPFQRDPAGLRIESVLWRRYASVAEVHARGCEMERLKNLRLAAARKPLKKYSGCRSAVVQAVRSITSGRRFAFAVTHAPESDNRAHTHIEIVAAPGNTAGKPNPNDIRELVELLVARFGPLDAHDCSAKP